MVIYQSTQLDNGSLLCEQAQDNESLKEMVSIGIVCTIISKGVFTQSYQIVSLQP